MRLQPASTGTPDVSDRITRDVGYTVDRFFREIRGSLAFFRGVNTSAAAGQLKHIQLFNPVGSARVVIVKGILVTVETAQEFDLRQYNTALTTLHGTGFNLNVGGAAAVAELRSQDNAAALGTQWHQAALQINLPLWLMRDWFVQLNAGQGIMVVAGSAATLLSAAFLWIEI